MPEPSGIVRWLTKNEESRLMQELPEHVKALAKFSLATGLRESNVTGLRWDQLDIQRRCAWIHANQAKAGKGISVPLNDEAIKIIREQLGKHHEYVFTYKSNKIIVANNNAWRKALKRAGIENFRWHDLRHTWASHHIQNGTLLHILKELGGWSDLSMVLRYAHLSSKHLEDYASNSKTMPTMPETNLLHAQKKA
jgi:integrase